MKNQVIFLVRLQEKFEIDHQPVVGIQEPISDCADASLDVYVMGGRQSFIQSIEDAGYDRLQP